MSAFPTKLFRTLGVVLLALLLLLGALPRAHAQQRAAAAPRTLVLYDAPPSTEFEKLGLGYAIMLKNLLSHFDSSADLLPVHQYTAGKLAGYDATFYMGSYYENPIPPALLADMAASQKTVVWFKYNLWQLAWNASYGFPQRFGFTFGSLRGLNAIPSASNPAPGFFDTVNYRNKPFVKYYAFDATANRANADPDVGIASITDPAKAASVVTMTNPKAGETAPYVVRSGNFWYFADLPFSYIGPRDRYLVFSDLLYDIMGKPAPATRRAMVRLEDVGALVSVQAMKTLTDYLYGKKIPFSIAVIPKHVDPLGVFNDDVPLTIPLNKATNLKKALNYALPRGAEIVMHGYTHQYGKVKNKNSGVSGDDWEFWDMVTNAPVKEDSLAWASGRYIAGLTDLYHNGYWPVAWETPHYQGSALASKAAAMVFPTTYQRVVYYTADKPNFNAARGKDFAVGQIFPYVIKKDHYGQRVLPENLGNIEYDISAIDPTSNFNYTWQDICTNAEYAATVRGGFASFFFHPFWLEPELNLPGMQDFKNVVDCITKLGFTWTAPSKVRD